MSRESIRKEGLLSDHEAVAITRYSRETSAIIQCEVNGLSVDLLVDTVRECVVLQSSLGKQIFDHGCYVIADSGMDGTGHTFESGNIPSVKTKKKR